MPRSYCPWPLVILLSDLRADLETKLGAEVYAAAWERGKTLDLETVAAALLDAFDDASPEPDH